MLTANSYILPPLSTPSLPPSLLSSLHHLEATNLGWLHKPPLTNALQNVMNVVEVVMKDAYIERCIEDLVRIYLPWASATTLHECVERTGPAARLVLTATCSSFLKRKASSPHPHCSQVSYI